MHVNFKVKKENNNDTEQQKHKAEQKQQKDKHQCFVLQRKAPPEAAWM